MFISFKIMVLSDAFEWREQSPLTGHQKRILSVCACFAPVNKHLIQFFRLWAKLVSVCNPESSVEGALPATKHLDWGW